MGKTGQWMDNGSSPLTSLRRIGVRRDVTSCQTAATPSISIEPPLHGALPFFFFLSLRHRVMG